MRTGRVRRCGRKADDPGHEPSRHNPPRRDRSPAWSRSAVQSGPLQECGSAVCGQSRQCRRPGSASWPPTDAAPKNGPGAPDHVRRESCRWSLEALEPTFPDPGRNSPRPAGGNRPPRQCPSGVSAPFSPDCPRPPLQWAHCPPWPWNRGRAPGCAPPDGWPDHDRHQAGRPRSEP